MKESNSLETLKIGKLGELLVQYQLLKHDVESAHLTTDSGIDLVAYSSGTKRPYTIQVKATLKPKPGGGKGRLALNWWVPDNSPAEIFAFVYVLKDRVWLFSKRELEKKAQQHSPNGKYQLYMTIDPESELKGPIGKAAQISKFDDFLLENRIETFF